MSHFAEVNPDTNTVIRVIVAEQDFINSGSVGPANRWIQTSYNTSQNVHYGVAANGEYLPDGGTPLRGNYAGIGYDYVVNVNGTGKDAFVPARSNNQWDSWKISNTTFQWDPPYSMPSDANVANSESYQWDENAYQANNQTGWIKIYN